ncbi:MAG: insulinase family protein [Myxococcaceae bacterium]|nr:insulinase family protein [Myxococcaceae bacterium]
MPLRYRLSNGLTVVFEEQHAARVAAFQVWVRAGSADEREDQAGLAHLHEHMLFKGTARRGPGEVAHDIEARGGEINAWTSFDQTVYHVVMASRFAREGLDVLADAVRSPAFEPSELAREIEVVCEEIKRSEDMPSRRASRELFSTAFRVHPYRRPVIGWEETVRGFSREKVLEFYERHYTPENMVLSVAGDLTEEQLRAWVEETLGGDWGRSYTGPVPREHEPMPEGPRVSLRREEVREAYLHLGFPIPSLEHPDTPALDVLAMLGGQGEASRLVREVKRRAGLVNDVHLSAYTPKDPGVMIASLTLPPAHAEAALEATVRTLAGLAAAPPSVEEVSTVQALIESEAVYQRETVQGLARKLGYFESGAGGIEAEKRYYEAVAQVTPERVQEVAQRYLDFDRVVVAGLLPGSVALDEGRVREVLAGASRTAHAAPPPRRTPPAHAPLQVMASLSRRRGGPLTVEQLPSGAQVVVREERAVPLVAMRAVFPGGLRYETPQDNGITTLLARMLTRGTATRDAEDITAEVDALSGSVSGAGGRNSVSLRAECLSRHFTRGFALVADCLLHPAFPEEELARERRLLLQDIHTREDKPASMAFDLFAKTLWERHPYRLHTHGEQHTVEALTREALQGYHARHMDPSQLTLAVVGDVDTDEVLARAYEAFGHARGPSAAPPPALVPEDPPREARQAKKVLARAQSHLVLGFPGARVSDAWRHALEVLVTVLSGQGGRLFVELRDKRSMAYSVSALSMEGLDPGYFGVYMGTSPEKVDAALDGIREQLRRVREEPISEAELSRAREHLIGTHEIGLQRNGARAALLALDHAYGLGAETFLHYAEAVSRVDAAAVLEVARRVIQLERATLAVVGP